MMHRAMVILGILACLAAPWTTSRAWAEDLSREDAQAIRAVVQSQLDAFAEDDADTAFDLASSSIRALLGSAENLLQLVKDQYPAVYRHRTVIFSMAEIIEGHTLQPVRLTDADNTVWIAIYIMQREADGSWKVDGCKLLETTSISI